MIIGSGNPSPTPESMQKPFTTAIEEQLPPHTPIIQSTWISRNARQCVRQHSVYVPDGHYRQVERLEEQCPTPKAHGKTVQRMKEGEGVKVHQNEQDTHPHSQRPCNPSQEQRMVVNYMGFPCIVFLENAHNQVNFKKELEQKRCLHREIGC